MSKQLEMTHEQVAEVGRCQRLLPKESDFIGKKGYKRKYRPDGTYEWKYSYTTNHNGKLTKEAQEVIQMMTPFSKADTERHLKMQRTKPRATLRDHKGQLCQVDESMADQTARANKWHHHWRPRGNRVEFGPDGMLFRCVGGDWEPLGVRCLGTPLRGKALVPRRGIQHDPDGDPWRWINGKWRRVA